MFKNFGIKLTAYTFTMKNEGKEVSRSSLQPCDIVFFNKFNHVGMAISTTQYIHAPQTGDFVKISDLSGRSDICMVMRVL